MRDTINTIARRTPKWLVYLLGALPAVYLYWAGLTGQLGIDPVKKIEHQLGEYALILFILGLAVTPLLKLLKVNIVKHRRPVGLLCFFYVVLHLSTWLLLDLQLIWPEIWKDILKRPYITIGMLAFVLMLPLALTSNDASIRKLGGIVWRRIHWLTYPAAFLGSLHYVMLTKVWEVEPLMYMTAILILLGYRLQGKVKSMQRRAQART